MDFYKSKKWLKLREKILKRDKYLCQHSLRYGRRVEANTVHHILPREQYPQFAWSKWNLISLSKEAHDKMHDRKTHKLTREGLDLAERTMEKHAPHL